MEVKRGRQRRTESEGRRERGALIERFNSRTQK